MSLRAFPRLMHYLICGCISSMNYCLTTLYCGIWIVVETLCLCVHAQLLFSYQRADFYAKPSSWYLLKPLSHVTEAFSRDFLNHTDILCEYKCWIVKGLFFLIQRLLLVLVEGISYMSVFVSRDCCCTACLPKSSGYTQGSNPSSW